MRVLERLLNLEGKTTQGKWYVGHLPKNTGGCRDIKVKPRNAQRQQQGAAVAYTTGYGDDAEDAANAEFLRRLNLTATDIVVRGHWRRQAHGPRHSLRRLTWIEPFVRRQTDAEPLGHDYTVKS